jgi:predicted Zn-dependent protease
MAHEMAHLTAGDSFKPRCCSLEESLNREMEADTLGVQYMKAADYDPAAMIEVMALIEDALPPGWGESRVKNLSDAITPNRLLSSAGHFHAEQSRQ